MFDALKSSSARRGDLILLFSNRERAFRYLKCILAGLPIWFAVGILMTFAPEFGKALGMFLTPSAGRAILYAYIGLVLGDLSSGLLSQKIKSRKKVMILYILLTALFCNLYFNAQQASLFEFYTLCIPIGFAVGYWAVFVTTAAEQFGTNLRATVATTVPNFVRGSVVPITWAFRELASSVGILMSAFYVGTACIVISLLAVMSLKESYAVDLDYIEE
jgi:hypothetical protein